MLLGITPRVAGAHVYTRHFVPEDRAALLLARDMWCAGPVAAADTYGAIGDWNVEAVTDMSYLFCAELEHCNPDCAWFNEDLSSWNVGSVTDMKGALHTGHPRTSMPLPPSMRRSAPLSCERCCGRASFARRYVLPGFVSQRLQQGRHPRRLLRQRRSQRMGLGPWPRHRRELGRHKLLLCAATLDRLLCWHRRGHRSCLVDVSARSYREMLPHGDCLSLVQL